MVDATVGFQCSWGQVERDKSQGFHSDEFEEVGYDLGDCNLLLIGENIGEHPSGLATEIIVVGKIVIIFVIVVIVVVIITKILPLI